MYGNNHRSLSVSGERRISGFPSAFSKNSRINDKFDFDPRVRQICSGERLGNVGLKICKMIVIGDVAVGKTCLINRFCKKSFDRDYKATIGVDFEVERFEILDTPFTLQMWDTAGQERFQCIASAYYRGANVIVVVFDVSDIKTLGNAEGWLAAARKETSVSGSTLVFLVGTKRDLITAQAYESVEKEAVKVASELGAEFWCVSSKTGERVKEFFFRVAALSFEQVILKELEQIEHRPSTQISAGKIKLSASSNGSNKKDKSSCCKSS